MNDRAKIKTTIRELILAVDDEDRWARANKTAGLICDALGYKEPVSYPHSNEIVNG